MHWTTGGKVYVKPYCTARCIQHAAYMGKSSGGCYCGMDVGREQRGKVLHVCRMIAHSMEHLFLFMINLTWLGFKGLAKIFLNWTMLCLSYECTRLTKASLTTH